MGSLDAPSIGAELADTVEFAKGEDVILFVNGKRYVLPLDIAHLTLLEYLRGSTHLADIGFRLSPLFL